MPRLLCARLSLLRLAGGSGNEFVVVSAVDEDSWQELGGRWVGSGFVVHGHGVAVGVEE
jgi:hypothetical protein